MEAADLSKTLVNTYNILLCYNTDDDILLTSLQKCVRNMHPILIGVKALRTKLFGIFSL